MVDKVRVELTSRGGLYPALPSATYPYKKAVLSDAQHRYAQILAGGPDRT